MGVATRELAQVPLAPRVTAASSLWAQALCLVALVLLAGGLRLYDLDAAAIWGDEGSSLLLAGFAPADIWAHAGHDVHPPLYFLMLHGWIALFGDSLMAVRLFSALPGTATVLVGLWLMRVIATPRAAWLGALLLALLPTAVRYSQEVRMYAWLGLWLLGATLALVYWVRRPERSRYLAVYALLMSGAFYTHYFTLFGVLVHWSYLALLRRQPAPARTLLTRPAWWLANGAIVLLYLPWVPSLIDLLRHVEALKVGGDIGWEPAVDLSSLPSMLWQLLAQDDVQGWTWPWLLALPLVVLALSVAAWRGDRGPYRFTRLLVLYWALPLLLIHAISLISPLFIERYLTAFALGLPLMLALVIERLARRSRGLALALLALIVGVEGLGLLNNYTVDPNDQFDTMVDYVNREFVAGDRIVTGDMLWYLSYVYYNRTPARPLLYTPPLADGRSTRPNDYGFGSLIEDGGRGVYLDSLATLPQGTGRVWLVMSRVDPDEFPVIPPTWRRMAGQGGGDAQAVLYQICQPCAGH